MSRERRTNSDVQGFRKRIKSLNGSIKGSEGTIDSHNISTYEPRKVQTKNKEYIQTPSKAPDAQQNIIDAYKLLKHFYQDEDLDYYNRVKKYFSVEWSSQKKAFNQHLNKLSYIENDMQKKNYNEIQLQIVIQWRKNPVLYCIRAFWYQYIITQKFVSIGDFMKKYNLFKQFIAQLAFYYFKRFFGQQGSNKDIQSNIIDKLTERTSHMIITHTTTWSKICDKHVLPLLKLKLSFTNIADIQLSKFKMDELEIKTIAVDHEAEQQQMPKTTDFIQKFIMENKMLEKIRLLIQIRQSMENQIRKRQQKLIKAKIIDKIKILDKDDFVDCLVYCIVKGDISMQNLALSIKYFYYILGADANNILSKFRCDAYLADLEVAYDFLLMHFEKKYAKSDQDNPIKHEKIILQSQ